MTHSEQQAFATRLAAIFRRRHGRRIRWRGRTRPATWIFWCRVGPLSVESNFSGLWTSQTIEAAQRSPLGMFSRRQQFVPKQFGPFLNIFSNIFGSL